jgi:hypothetical protein
MKRSNMQGVLIPILVNLLLWAAVFVVYVLII